MEITQVAGSIPKERILTISIKMDWIFVNYYKNDLRNFTVLEEPIVRKRMDLNLLNPLLWKLLTYLINA